MQRLYLKGKAKIEVLFKTMMQFKFLIRFKESTLKKRLITILQLILMMILILHRMISVMKT